MAKSKSRTEQILHEKLPMYSSSTIAFTLPYGNTLCQCSVCGKTFAIFCYFFAVHLCNQCIKRMHPKNFEAEFIFSSGVCLARPVHTFKKFCLECKTQVSNDHKNCTDDHVLIDISEKYYLKYPMKIFELLACALSDSEPRQISFQPPNKLCISNSNGIIFIVHCDTGKILDTIQTNQRYLHCGWSTVTKAGELLYIDKSSKTIRKYQGNEMNSSPVIWLLEGTPICICTNNWQKDILILLHREDNANSTLVRFDQQGRQLWKVSLNWKSSYITENGNGDICTSCSEIVGIKVLCNEAKYEKFSYTGREGESNFAPSKICTDSSCKILILNDTGNNIHVIDEYGQFLRLIVLNLNTMYYGFAFCADDSGVLWTCTYNQINKYGYLNGGEECNKGNHIYLHRRAEKANMFCSVPIKYWEVRIAENKEGGQDLHHITFLPPDKICVSDNNSGVILIFNGEQLTTIKTNQHFPIWGFHTATRSGNLLWVDTSDKSIKCYQVDSGTITTIMWTGDWRPYSVFSSPINNDILVGMIKDDESKVVRFDPSGTTLWESQKGLILFPLYITENKNGDTCVSDCHRNKAVVVFNMNGRYRFSYTGLNDGSKFYPAGICTDEFSQILINNSREENVHIIDQDGQFIRILMTKLQFMEHERGICLDSYGNIWVCGNRKAKMYRYLKME